MPKCFTQEGLAVRYHDVCIKFLLDIYTMRSTKDLTEKPLKHFPLQLGFAERETISSLSSECMFVRVPQRPLRGAWGTW